MIPDCRESAFCEGTGVNGSGQSYHQHTPAAGEQRTIVQHGGNTGEAEEPSEIRT